MTIRLFNKIAASPNPRLYLSLEPPAVPDHLVPVRASEVLLFNGNEGGFFVWARIGSCFNGDPGPIVDWIKIGAAGRPHLLRDVNNCRIKNHSSVKLPFDTIALILAAVELERCSILFWKWHKDLARDVGAT